MHFRGLADHPPVPSQEQTQAAGRPGQVSYPTVCSGEEGDKTWSSLRHWGQQKHLFGVWRLPAQTSCWEGIATKCSGPGCQEKLCSLPPQGCHPVVRGLPLLATGPGLRGTKAAGTACPLNLMENSASQMWPHPAGVGPGVPTPETRPCRL